ncbi:MAG TPA: L-histidine N(alpha)-methyltransferase [Rhodocyclaceae bacterium]
MQNGFSRREIVAGLCAAKPSLPPKYLYDEFGSRLFELITRLPEYYPTRLELGLIAAHAGDIAEAAGRGSALIDLGAGNCAKARALFPVLRPSKYVAVDISADFLDQALGAIHAAFPDIDTVALAADLSEPIGLPPALDGTRRVFFYPGSSIGNLDPDDAAALLRRLHRQCDGAGGLLIGVDLLKDSGTLHAAYNDALGLTAAFNLNLLNHVNALLGSDFRPADWRHRAFFNPGESRIEMHLDARCEVAVHWDGAERRFAAGESIHTENSYKFRLDAFEAMLAQAGFRDMRAWTDERGWFAVCYAAA